MFMSQRLLPLSLSGRLVIHLYSETGLKIQRLKTKIKFYYIQINMNFLSKNEGVIWYQNCCALHCCYFVSATYFSGGSNASR